MKEKDKFNKIVIIGMTVVSIVLIGFSLITYFSYGDNTPEVR